MVWPFEGGRPCEGTCSLASKLDNIGPKSIVPRQFIDRFTPLMNRISQLPKDPRSVIGGGITAGGAATAAHGVWTVIGTFLISMGSRLVTPFIFLLPPEPEGA